MSMSSERRALQELCSILGQAELCPAALPRGATLGHVKLRTWRGRNEECWLGNITTLVAAFVAAIQSFSPTSKQVKLLLLAIRRYLVRSWGRFQVPPLQVMLSGWPIFQLLWRLPGRETDVTPESRELHRRAHAMSRVIRKCWQGPQQPGTRRLSCSCQALRPVAKAASRTWSRKSSLLALSHGCTARSLHRAQRALLALDTSSVSNHVTSNPLWHLDFLIPSIFVNDWLGYLGQTTASAWRQSFEQQLLTPSNMPTEDSLDGLAFATLLEDDGFDQWSEALDVMSWSLLQFHAVIYPDGEKTLAVPLLVLCPSEKPLVSFNSRWLQRGLVPVHVPNLPTQRPAPGGWRRLQLWSFVQFRRILYMDTDILVTGTLWHLLKLPSAIHFAASGLGLDHQEIRHQRLNSGVMVITPDIRIFEAMRRVLEDGLLHQHPEVRLQGNLDQAWIDLFFRYISTQPRGGTVPETFPAGLPYNASIWDVCPPGAVEEPPEVREVPVDGIVGAKTLDINVCLLNPSNNFLVSFNGLLLSSTLSLHKSIPLEWCAHIQEQAEGTLAAMKSSNSASVDWQ
eukprot:symbB.v1.2.029918.t1/scaffold3323.1/size59064/4